MNIEKNCTPATAIEGVHTSENLVPLCSPSTLPRDCDYSARVAAFFQAHDVHPERGEYWGDGVARTLDGTPFEPLSWGHTLIFGRGDR